MTRAWRRTSSILALTIAGIAAQANAQTDGQTRGSAPQQQDANGETDQQGLQEIIVTAQRKAENLQRAGIPVAVVTGDQLVSRGLTSSNELGNSVPSLSAQPQGAPTPSSSCAASAISRSTATAIRQSRSITTGCI